MRPAGVEDRVAGAAALRIGADGDPRHGQDRLDVVLGHAVDDDRDVEAVLDEDIEGQVGRVGVLVTGKLGQGAPGPRRPAGRPRDPDPGPARVGGDVLPAGDPALDLGTDEIADVRIGQGGHALVDAQRLERRRQDGRQGRRGGRVRVMVRRDIETLGTRRLQPGDGLAGPSPDGARGAFQVRDLETRARPGRPDGRDRLVERREQVVALVAHVGRVQPARAALAVTSASISAARAWIPGA